MRGGRRLVEATAFEIPLVVLKTAGVIILAAFRAPARSTMSLGPFVMRH
jgi:hypothetical protein